MTKISLAQLDLEIEQDAALSYIEHRKLKKKPLTQRAFDQAMKKALLAFEVGMTPTELIDWTIDKGWDGINIAFTKSALNREVQAVAEISGRSTRDISLDERLNNRSWGESIKTKEQPIQKQLTDTSWVN